MAGDDEGYRHTWLDGSECPWPAGKVVCVGRNYLDHIRELGNPVPERPVLFMKPSTALAPLQRPLALPAGQGACHHEVELAVLIGAHLSAADAAAARAAAAGYAIALDLTLRDVQQYLKERSQPWELAKAFDASCPISPFVGADALEPDAAGLELRINGEVRQQGSTRQMMRPLFDLVAAISRHFTLLPGDVVLTGTPAGVGPLAPGDRLELVLDGRYRFTTEVASSAGGNGPGAGAA
jgi:2-keto-4-pentenoate hydratase/2-oxohepta-3-ene-1,7-dioic acid hydratase in catechol pathway